MRAGSLEGLMKTVRSYAVTRRAAFRRCGLGLFRGLEDVACVRQFQRASDSLVADRQPGLLLAGQRHRARSFPDREPSRFCGIPGEPELLGRPDRASSGYRFVRIDVLRSSDCAVSFDRALFRGLDLYRRPLLGSPKRRRNTIPSSRPSTSTRAVTRRTVRGQASSDLGVSNRTSSSA